MERDGVGFREIGWDGHCGIVANEVEAAFNAHDRDI
jgi:hypothetical protein